MRKKKARGLKTLVITLSLAVIAAAAFLIYMIANDLKLEEAEKIAEEITQRESDEKEKEQDRLDRIAEEKAQWYLILVNNYNAMPDDFDIETVEV